MKLLRVDQIAVDGMDADRRPVIEPGYSVLVVDREGDQLGLATRPGVHLVDAAEHLPTPSDLLSIARPNRARSVLAMSGLSTGRQARLYAAIACRHQRRARAAWDTALGDP